MRIDLDSRLSLGFAFGILGLTIELIGSLVGLPVSSALATVFGSIILGTFGIGLVVGSQTAKRKAREDDENGGNGKPRSDKT